MATPDKNQPKKHFFKFPDKFEKLSQAEKDAFYDLIVDTLLAQGKTDEKTAEKTTEKTAEKAEPERE